MIVLREETESLHSNQLDELAEPDYIAPLDFVLAYRDPKDGSAMATTLTHLHSGASTLSFWKGPG